MSEVYRIALSPARIEHPLGLGSHTRARFASLVRIPVICTQILGQARAYTAFIPGVTVLAYYSFNFGLRIWDIAALTAEYRKSTDGYTHMLQGTRDGWVITQDNKPLFWVPVEHRKHLYVPLFKVVVEGSQISTFFKFMLGRNWTECMDNE